MQCETLQATRCRRAGPPVFLHSATSCPSARTPEDQAVRKGLGSETSALVVVPGTLLRDFEIQDADEVGFDQVGHPLESIMRLATEGRVLLK